MNMNFCPRCGERLRLREREREEAALYCGRCAEFRFPMFSAAVAAVVLSEDGEKMLLIRQYGEERFVLPAGYIDKGETAEAALTRELREELGIGIKNHRFIKSRYYAPSETLMLNYAVTAADTIPSPNWEVDSWQWVRADEAIDYVNPNGLAEAFLRDYEEWLKNK